MKGKTLFISGGTRGIGKAIVYAFAAKGCDVAFTMHLVLILQMRLLQIYRVNMESNLVHIS